MISNALCDIIYLKSYYVFKEGLLMKKKKKLSPAQQEAELEREGQTTLAGMPHHSKRGGARQNAGRKPHALGGKARPHSIWCSDVEYNELMRHLKYWRKAHARMVLSE